MDKGMLWKDKYELGVALIDEQHQELFKRVDAFLNVLRSNSPTEEKREKVSTTLEFMKGYVVEHFCDEEEYQRRIGYPNYEGHKKIHEDMVNYVVEVSKEYENNGYDEQFMQQFGGKLLAWLINHVASEDQKIASFAIEQGVAGHEHRSV